MSLGVEYLDNNVEVEEIQRAIYGFMLFFGRFGAHR